MVSMTGPRQLESVEVQTREGWLLQIAVVVG